MTKSSDVERSADDVEEQRARIEKLKAEIEFIRLQRKLYPIVITGGALIGIAAIVRLFV